jgi:transposase
VKKSRWLLLKRKKNLTGKQRFRLRDVLRYNLKTVRAYLLKEAFQQLWDYDSPAWAPKFLDEWCRQTMRSRIEPMKKIAGPYVNTVSSSSITSVLKSCFPPALSRA